MQHHDVKQLVLRLTGEHPLAVDRIRAGRNSRVYRVQCDSGQTYAAKFYMHPTADGRSRLEQEWSALKFMSASGINNIPQPIAFDHSAQAAVYSFLYGSPATPHTEQDINTILSFLEKLKSASLNINAANILPAAESCFSPAEVEANINVRLEKLQQLPAKDQIYQEMNSFLKNDFCRELTESLEFADKPFPGPKWHQQLPKRFRTLSPSDFGFHNALRTGKNLSFVDFEYFGWDDPVKAAADFLLHPAMNLTDADINTFYQGMCNIFNEDSLFEMRFRAYLPLFRLKWCLILLNEFMNIHLERRKFANEAQTEDEDIKSAQLEKSKNFLNKDEKILSVLF